MAVHQLVPHFRLGDETAQAAVQFRALLRRLGHWGGLYAGSQEPGAEALVQPLKALRVQPGDWVLLHHAIGQPPPGPAASHARAGGGGVPRPPLAAAARGTPRGALPCSPRGPSFREWRRTCRLGIGLSGFASAELSRAGYGEVHTVPLFVEAERFAQERADPALRARLGSGALTLVSVGPVTREARLEDLLALHREVLRIRPDARLVIAGAVDPDLERARVRGGAHARRDAARRGEPRRAGGGVPERLGPGLDARARRLGRRAARGDGRGAPRAGVRRGRRAGDAGRRRHRIRREAVRAPRRGGGAAGNRPAAPGAGAERAVRGGSRRRGRSGPRSGSRPRWRAWASGAHDAPGARRGDAPGWASWCSATGAGITGGAEAHAAQVVARLLPRWDIRVLTSCAVDHLTWANALPAGETRVDGVPVLRFANPRPRLDAGAERALAPALRPLARP